ncbi:hypothetical protein GCM10018966_002300 [Streptomyces yanii]
MEELSAGIENDSGDKARRRVRSGGKWCRCGRCPDSDYRLPPLQPLSRDSWQPAVALWFGATAGCVGRDRYYSSRSIWLSLILSSRMVASFWTA